MKNKKHFVDLCIDIRIHMVAQSAFSYHFIRAKDYRAFPVAESPRRPMMNKLHMSQIPKISA